MSDTTTAMVWPALRARDARGLIRFLVEAFGFEEAAVYGEGDQVFHAELLWPLGGGIYVVADDVDALFARAVAAGAAVLREPQDTDHGSREFAVRDPEGNHWSFGTYRGAGA
jgi:uncharacterized glyoxalase superfamily protein PhnB